MGYWGSKGRFADFERYFKRCFEGYFSYRAEFPSYPPPDTLTDRFLHLTLFFYFAQVCKGPFEFVAEVF